MLIAPKFRKTGLLFVTTTVVFLLVISWQILNFSDIPSSVDYQVEETTNSTLPFKYAIFLQLGVNSDLFNELLQCASNTAAAMNGESYLDIYLSVLKHDILKKDEYQRELSKLPSVDRVFVSSTDNEGADYGQFMAQLQLALRNRGNYLAILKTHSKSDNYWRRRMIESLCGSPNQVRSILSGMAQSEKVKLVAPLGTTFGPSTPVDLIYPRIREIYGMNSCMEAFDSKTVLQMESLYNLLSNTNTDNPKSIPQEDLVIVAGSSFWIDWGSLQVDKWVKNHKTIRAGFTKGYSRNLGMEHVLERLIPTMLKVNGWQIAEITPAPKVFALYFPQFHAFPENDRFWGTNFTEWTLLKPLDLTPPVRKPLPVEEGGLGYYNLLEKEPRKRQAEIAREYGVEGFVYYHYWFSGSQAPKHHYVMNGVLDAMLLDGEPNLPFFLSWANEPWNRRWTGQDVPADKGLLISQDYGDMDEWKEHFEYLLKFFHHPNYVKKDGCPVFVIYRTEHINEKLEPMLNLWRIMALKAGFAGMWFIQTVGSFFEPDRDPLISKPAGINGSFHFWPAVQRLDKSFQSERASIHDMDLHMEDTHSQYWGACTGFDRRPREPVIAKDYVVKLTTPEMFTQSMNVSFKEMSAYSNRKIDVNYFFINAWNEWNEQALLEPDSQLGFAFIEKLRKNLQSVPLEIFKKNQ
jgi:Glycosyltransferase WbsX